MRVLRYFGVAFDSIRSHMMRAILTMLGIIIGIVAVLSTVGMGSGAAVDITERIESGGTNLLTVSSTGSNLTMSDAEALADTTTHPTIGQVAVEYSSNATIVAGSTETSNQVYGVEANYDEVSNSTIAEGQFLTQEQVEGQELVAVIGSTVASDLFDGVDALGQEIRINGDTFQVIGVMEEEGGRDGPDNTLFVPIGIAQGRLFNADRYRGSYTVTGISVQATSSETVDAAEIQVERTLRMLHGLDTDTDNDFSIFNQASLLEMASDISGTMTTLLGSIGAVSL